ncbi:MAG: hypothetical protein AAF570_24650, partial [Bacteroidota bacterium]
MRSDFLGDCPRLPGLTRAINDGQYLVPRLDRRQMRSAVTGPVAVFRDRIAPDLVIRLLNDVGDSPDQLPILQHALMRTWDFHTVSGKQEIILEDYEAIGGMRNALDQHAEEIYAELEADGLGHVVEALFRALTELEADGRGIRRPSLLSEVCAVGNVSKMDVIKVVEAFRKPGRSFLMPPAGTPLDDDTILDISHESFMRLWKRLRAWVEDEAKSAEQYLRLARASRDHQQGIVNLWRQPELGIALQWWESAKPTKAWGERYDDAFDLAVAFLMLSKKAWEEEQAEAERVLLLQQETEQKRKTVWWQRILIGVLVGLLFFSGIVLYWALSERNRADNAVVELEHEKENVIKQKDIAEDEKAKSDSLKGVAEELAHSVVSKNQDLQAQKAALEKAQDVLKNSNNQLETSKRDLERTVGELAEKEKEAQDLAVYNSELAQKAQVS